MTAVTPEMIEAGDVAAQPHRRITIGQLERIYLAMKAIDPEIERLREAAVALDDRLASIGGCTDGHCIIAKPKGMHTNGGCFCWRDAMKMQRLAYAYNQFRISISQTQPQAQDSAQ
jgi:hypothetical protein